MTTYASMISTLQSNLSKRAWAITKEQAFREFYKEKGRVVEAAASKKTLKELYKQQVNDKAMLKVLQELHSYELEWDKNPAQFLASREDW